MLTLKYNHYHLHFDWHHDANKFQKFASFLGYALHAIFASVLSGSAAEEPRVEAVISIILSRYSQCAESAFR